MPGPTIANTSEMMLHWSAKFQETTTPPVAKSNAGSALYCAPTLILSRSFSLKSNVTGTVKIAPLAACWNGS